MGDSYRNSGQIKDFWPDNTETTLYLDATFPLDIEEVLAAGIAHFGDKNFTVYAKEIHTQCLTYDLYDSADWTDFLVLEKVG